MTPPKLSEMPYERPDLDATAASSEARRRELSAASTASSALAAVKAWDREAMRFDTARSLAGLRYQCDTRSAATKAEREYFDDTAPQFYEVRLAFLREAVSSRFRPELERELGRHAFAVWERELTSYDPVIADDRRAESRLCRRYTELLTDVRVPWRGTSLTLAQLSGWFGDPDRATRLAAQQARFAALDAHREELDALFHDMTALRDGMGRKMGHDGYTPLAYILRGRDYSPAQVAAFRRQVREILVPLASRIRRKHAAALGVTDYAFHDTSVTGPEGVPRPKGSGEWLLARAGRLFDELGSDFGRFWGLLRECELLDLEARDGKSGGGFCTDLPEHGVPFVFANFNGTADDVDVFTHECGHAFQAWRSMAEQPLLDYFSPTADAAEIHSMSLEMLSHPLAELFFEGEAERYRQGHLEKAVLFIPYGTAVDEYQHEVYRQPGLSPAQRAELWRSLERAYLPERIYRDMPFAESGRFWQVQRHVYLHPFYYIDYCLAQTCALQFWRRAQADRDGAMAAYRRLCELGGSLPFSGLVEAAGLVSPFAEGSVARIAEDVERAVLSP